MTPQTLVAARPGTDAPAELRLSDVPLRQTVELLRIDLSDEAAAPLMERGVLPGCSICPVRLTPSGDPVLLVDGTLLALRREVARCLCVSRPAGEA